MIPDTVLEFEENIMRTYGRLTFDPPPGAWKMWFDDNDNPDNFVAYEHIHELYLDVWYAMESQVDKIENQK